MGFLVSEVVLVEFDDGLDMFGLGLLLIVCMMFMGLYGVDVVMLLYLIDEIVLCEEGYEVVEVFFD